MRRSEVEADEETVNISETPWAYVPSTYDSPRRFQSAKSSSLFSVFCCCFGSNESDRRSYSDVSVDSTSKDPPVILSRALLCLDNPQIPSGQVSFPVTEEFILANRRCQNVLKKPYVTKSTQMFFMGYDPASLRAINLSHKDSSSNIKTTTIIEDCTEAV